MSKRCPITSSLQNVHPCRQQLSSSLGTRDTVFDIRNKLSIQFTYLVISTFEFVVCFHCKQSFYNRCCTMYIHRIYRVIIEYWNILCCWSISSTDNYFITPKFKKSLHLPLNSNFTLQSTFHIQKYQKAFGPFSYIEIPLAFSHFSVHDALYGVWRIHGSHNLTLRKGRGHCCQSYTAADFLQRESEAGWSQKNKICYLKLF